MYSSYVGPKVLRKSSAREDPSLSMFLTSSKSRSNWASSILIFTSNSQLLVFLIPNSFSSKSSLCHCSPTMSIFHSPVVFTKHPNRSLLCRHLVRELTLFWQDTCYYHLILKAMTEVATPLQTTFLPFHLQKQCLDAYGGWVEEGNVGAL